MISRFSSLFLEDYTLMVRMEERKDFGEGRMVVMMVL
jgi:hypothetical protein